MEMQLKTSWEKRGSSHYVALLVMAKLKQVVGKIRNFH
jgi:hypothetical protein